jgi:hypothetical protein
VGALQLAFLGPAWLVSKVTGPILADRSRGMGRGGVRLFPNALIQGDGHYPHALLACFPLLLLALRRWGERPGPRRAVWLAAALAFCWLTNPYYGTMAFVVVVVGAAAVFLRTIRSSGGERRHAPLTRSRWLRPHWWCCRWRRSSGRHAAPSRTPSAAPGWTWSSTAPGLSDYLLPDFLQEGFREVLDDARCADLGAPGGDRADLVGYVTLCWRPSAW